MKIRKATIQDLDAVAAVEAECFPAAEAASREAFTERLAVYGDHFLLMFDEKDNLISFVDGFVTDEEILTDEMFADAGLHNEQGAWQMIFGVNTIPSRRCNGYAGQLLKMMIEDAKKQGRKGVILTCKKEKIAYYAKFGFVDEGVSADSTHGGAVWHQMRVLF
jgi:N-acetylglutamate synthase-like GNAT family acetyltransferase